MFPVPSTKYVMKYKILCCLQLQYYIKHKYRKLYAMLEDASPTLACVISVLKSDNIAN